MKQLTDEDLMHDVANGNLDAMSFIFERYHLKIYNFLLQMTRNKAIAEDLTQSVFYKAIRYRTSYKGGQFASWIFKIARNLFKDHYHKQKRSFTNVQVDDLATNVVVEDEMDQSENNAHLYNVLNKLKSEEKELIVMNRIQEMNYSTIAKIVESSEGAVKVKVHRIIKKLRTVYFETT